MQVQDALRSSELLLPVSSQPAEKNYCIVTISASLSELLFNKLKSATLFSDLAGDGRYWNRIWITQALRGPIASNLASSDGGIPATCPLAEGAKKEN